MRKFSGAGAQLKIKGGPRNFRGVGPKTRGGRGPPGPPCCAPPEENIRFGPENHSHPPTILRLSFLSLFHNKGWLDVVTKLYRQIIHIFITVMTKCLIWFIYENFPFKKVLSDGLVYIKLLYFLPVNVDAMEFWQNLEKSAQYNF